MLWLSRSAANSGYKDGVGSSFDEWADEAQYYNWSNPGYSESTGHFTQVVWKATSQLGCGIATCGPNTIFEDWQQVSRLSRAYSLIEES